MCGEIPVKKAALLSVSDRSGLVEFATVLRDCGYVLLATSGTTKFLSEHGVASTPIEEYTGQKEILDGRVKTLHPKIHAGLLAKRDNPEHVRQLEAEGILPIDVAVVNLYPFIQNLNSENAKNPAKMVELIDIGGPTMIRAAAKNHRFVLPVIDPADYPQVAEYLKSASLSSKDSAQGLELRRVLAAKVFTRIAHYNLEIAKYLTHVQVNETAGQATVSVDMSDDFAMGETAGLVLSRLQSLRYGENPQQEAALYRDLSQPTATWEQLHGKELSYNNLLDFDASLRLIRTLDGPSPCACIIKHLNPCGAARGATLLEALQKAKRGDPRSHFGGILAFNQRVGADVANAVREDFAEIVVAPDFEPEALEVLKTSKNLRLLRVPMETAAARRFEVRVVEGGVLIQENDHTLSDVREAKQVSKRAPSAVELRDLEFAWRVCGHVKSNAIVLVKDETLVGVGAGQMSRIDSVELAISKAHTHKHDLKGAVCASDAFFPFPDNVEALGEAGIQAVIAPSGAKRDQDAVTAADTRGMALLFALDRHFRH
jgi:phosphoribosylaminoimidazolecarboxamide formyltransferase / IMP cyclohydrolase